MPGKVLNCRFAHPEAAVKLFCFPWAGGGAAFYSNWGKLLPNSIEVHGICLPGREHRYSEPVFKDLQDALEEAIAAIHEAAGNTPFALWGHSLGSYLVVEAACLLKSRYNMEPVHIFVSGASSTHSPQRKAISSDVSQKSDEEFIELLKMFDGTPADILENRELMAFFLPALKADYCLIPQINSLPPSERLILTCPVTVFDGLEDIKHDLQSWKDWSTGEFTINMLKGGHFYLKDQPNLDTIIKHITGSLEGCPV